MGLAHWAAIAATPEQEQTENEATIADAQAGAAAVKSALVVLRNFYDSQSFIQQAPEMKS